MKFSDPLLTQLLQEIISENRKEGALCPISKLHISNNNGITLPCGHKFIYSFLEKSKSKGCPYCSQRFEIEMKKCLECNELTPLDCELCKKHSRNTCCHILKNGNKCKKISKEDSEYCHIHMLK